MDENQARPSSRDHNAFWTLQTETVNRFLISSIERWLWPIESALCLAKQTITPNYPDVSSSSLQWYCITSIACIFTLRILFTGQGSRQSHMWQDRYGRRPLTQSDENAIESGDVYLSSTERHGLRGLRFKTSIEKWGVAYFPKQFLIFERHHIPVFKRRILARLGLAKKSIVPFGFTLPSLDLPNIAIIRRYGILLTLLSEAKDWNEYSFALMTAAQICIQAYIKQVYRTLYDRSICSRKRAPKKEGKSSYKTFNEFLKPLNSEERDGIAGLDKTIINKLFLAHNEGLPPLGFQDTINLAGGRNQQSLSNSFKDISDDGKYINALRPIFDARLFLPNTPGWAGSNDNMEPPVWPMNEFREILQRVYQIVDNILPPEDCVLDENENPAYSAFEEAGGFPTFLCIQAAKTLWLILAYEKRDISTVAKDNKSNTTNRNQLIKQTALMKRTRFWSMTPPVEATNILNGFNLLKKDNLNLSWQLPIRLSRDLHDILYISFLNDATNLLFPKNLTVKRSHKDDTPSWRLQKLPSSCTPTEQNNIFHWRRLLFAKALDLAIKGWGEEIHELEEQENSNSDSNSSDDDDFDFANDDDNDTDPIPLLKYWANAYKENVCEELKAIFKFHFDYATIVPEQHTFAQKPKRRMPWSPESKSSQIQIQKIKPIREEIAKQKVYHQLPPTKLPGVHYSEDQFHSALSRYQEFLGNWKEVELDSMIVSRAFCVGGPTDVIRPKSKYIAVKKGWRYVNGHRYISY